VDQFNQRNQEADSKVEDQGMKWYTKIQVVIPQNPSVLMFLHLETMLIHPQPKSTKV